MERCLDQSKREVEKTLLAQQSEPARILTQEKIKLIESERAEVRFSVGKETLARMERAKELLGDQSLEAIFDRALQVLVQAEEKKRGMGCTPAKTKANISIEIPTQLAEEAALNSRFIPINMRRIVFERSQGQCEFVDAETQKRCSSRYQLHIDHVLPLALGGKTIQLNLRHLCMNHNLRAAMEMGMGVSRCN